MKKNIRVKTRQKFVNNISVTPTNVEKVILQKEDRGKWVNKKNFISDSKGIAKIEYPKEINKKSKSVWRIYIPETKETTGYYSDKIFITVLRTYQTPGKYHKINDQRIVLKGGGYTLRLGYMGLKVRKVNSYFHIGSYHWPRYTATTKMKVRRFQKRHHLKATGNVDKKTWLKMGFSEKSWYQMGAYTSPIGVDLTYTKKTVHQRHDKTRYEIFKGKGSLCCGSIRNSETRLRLLGFYNAMPVFRRDKSVAYKCSASFKTGI